MIDRLTKIVQEGKDNDAVAAANLLFQRGWGKAPQTVNLKTRPNEKRLAVLDVIQSLPPEVVTQVIAAFRIAELPEDEPKGNPS